MAPILDIVGCCPMGCGQHLHRMPGGIIQCLAKDCPDPGAVGKLLSDVIAAHRLRMDDEVWTVIHPLSERLDPKALSSCQVMPDWGMKPGTYVLLEDGSWQEENG